MIDEKTRMVPMPVKLPPIIKLSTPKKNKIALNLIKNFLLISFSSVFIKSDVSMELINNATNNEEPNTMDKVIGKIFMKLPIIPGQKPSGTKAATDRSEEHTSELQS